MEPIRKDLYFTLSAEDALQALDMSAERSLADEEARRDRAGDGLRVAGPRRRRAAGRGDGAA